MGTLVERLATCYASAVHDVLRGLGHHDCVLPPTIRGLDPTRALVGEVYTISGHIDHTLSRDETLLRWARVLSRVPGGKVLVCQPNTKAVALMGELSAHALEIKGTRGYVVDGPVRDADFLLKMGFPTYCELTTPADICARWTYDRLGEPITIGNVTLRTGDWLIADRDGVVVIPGEAAEEAVAGTEAVMATESDMRRAILGGMDAEEAYLKYRKF